MSTLTHTRSLQIAQPRTIEISLKSILTAYVLCAFVSLIAGFSA